MLRTASVSIDKIAPPTPAVRHGGRDSLVLRPAPRIGGYEVVLGHGKYERAVRAGLPRVFCLIREADASDPLDELAEMQLGGYSPIEEARVLKAAMKQLNMGQRELAAYTGISQSHISKRLTLLKLAPAILALLDDCRISIDEALRMARRAM